MDCVLHKGWQKWRKECDYVTGAPQFKNRLEVLQHLLQTFSVLWSLVSIYWGKKSFEGVNEQSSDIWKLLINNYFYLVMFSHSSRKD